jgi:hypothetical protein
MLTSTIQPAIILTPRQLTYYFLRLANFDSGVFERLNRYEAALWRASPCKLGIATFARETAACS